MEVLRMDSDPASRANSGDRKHADPQNSRKTPESHSAESHADNSGYAKHDEKKPKHTDPLPHIALKHGGGAIHGIGEKFSVNAATGTAEMAIHLTLSPGRSEFTPALELSYDSGSGNGPFGFGWKLSVPAITRKTDKGLPQYCDGDESDVFILAGAEDLVPILDAKGARVHSPRTVFGINYDIHTYRPRIEGLFSRVERWVNVATGISHWRTISTSNVTTLYGYDNLSSIADPADPRKIFSWLICRSWDDKGNAVTYSHLAEDDQGIDLLQSSEANRTSGVRATQRYLSLVCYGNTNPYLPVWNEAGQEKPVPTDWLFKVVLDYGDHGGGSPSPQPGPGWPVRLDPFSAYRATFEVRTYRRVQRILYFNNFPQEAGVGADCLVRSTDFLYSDQQTAFNPLNPIYTFLVSATQTGYRLDGTAYTSRSLPPVEFEYSQPQIQQEVETADPDSLRNLPEGIDGTRFQWIDLDGEGTPGVLADWGDGWGYKPNLSPANRTLQPDGSLEASVKFGPLETVALLPSRSALAGQHLVDLSGAGRLDLVDFDRPAPGFFVRTADENWEPFQPFQFWPDIDWSDPNVKFVDLTGDGLTDVFITEDGVYTLYPSVGESGYGEALLTRTPWDEDRGPKVVMADGTETMFLADMTGDGLSDVVRVRNGEVSYWPNLGYGRFGPRVSMDRAPRFIDEDRFDPQRIRLADVDGSGTADLVYIGGDGVQVCFNQSGNAWSTPNRIAVFPTADKLSNVQVTDLLGTGTACLVWSSPLPGEMGRALRYVDLMGGMKPHLLTLMRNNLGSETRVTYAPSTQFYVADKNAGQPWVTRLPFPVQVVERVESFDWIGRARLVTRYSYHHGYFDGHEREFRGFGRVDQWDTEEYRSDTAFPDGDALNWNQQSWTPPMLTRTWFHTGAFEEAIAVSQQYAGEYWVEPALRGAQPPPMLLPDTVIPAGVNPFEMREAYRSLKGHMLRSEVYAQDGSFLEGNPYAVTEQNFTIEFLQPMGVNQHAVFYAHPRESISFHYERNPADPRVTHEFTLEVDSVGNVLRSVSVGYPRRAGYAPPEPTLSAQVRGMLAYDQGRLHVLSTMQEFTNGIDVADVYREPLPYATIAAEVTGIAPAANLPGVTNLFGFDELDAIWKSVWEGTHDVAYESIPASDVDGAGSPAASPTRRIVHRSLTLYRSDDLTALLQPGQLQSLALPGDSYHAALTPGMLTTVFGGLVTNATLAEGGYVQLPGDTAWWVPEGRVYLSPGDTDTPAQEFTTAQENFFLPWRAVDPFGGITRVTYDAYDLLSATATDAVSNITLAVNDYRVLQPVQVTDPNGNRAQVAFDVLGMVVGAAVMGKTTENLGDSLTGFAADLDEATIVATMNNPLGNPGTILAGATSRIVYDIDAFLRTGTNPPAVYTRARETHVSDLGAGQTTQYQHKFTYSDGFARQIQSKQQAAPGPLTEGGPTVTPRWMGSGWTIFNKKGKPIRKYEPFFSATNAFEFAAVTGVSSVLFYDPPGRRVAVLHPDNTWEKTVFDGWRRETWDGNDTVLISDPRTDPDVGDHFLRLLETAAFVSWHDLRIGGTYGTTPDDQAAQKNAAQKTEAHAATPAVEHFDALGHTCLGVADNGGGVRYPARHALDCEGNTLAIFDPLGRRAAERVFRAPQYFAGTDMAGNPVYQSGMDNGWSRTLMNAVANPIRSWDARGNAFRDVYDAAHRPTERHVSTNGAKEILIQLLVYGEGLSGSNLCGRLFRQYDAAGLAIHSQHDFKGNVVAIARQLANQYQQSPDWTPLAGLTSAATLDAAGAALLVKTDLFVSSTVFDALNRAVQQVTPHNSAMSPNVIQPTFNEASQLIQMDVWLQQAGAPTQLLDPSTAGLHALLAADYNARGQRIAATLANQTVSTYAYDPQTFRLTNLVTNRPNSFAANQQNVQNLFYYYDPVGDITRFRDTADTQDVIYFNNQRVDPTADYTYDPTYRLLQASGREHLGQNGGALNAPNQITNDDTFRVGLPQPGDGKAMGTYTETYSYDPAGNIVAMAHAVGSGGWTRRYTYAEPSQIVAAETGNRLSTTSLPGDPVAGPFTATYGYDAHGNMTRMPHLPALSWDEENRLRSTTRQVVNAGTPVTTFYTYDADGQRVCKATNGQSAGPAGVLQSERIYLGAVEVYREFAADGTGPTLQRETLHVMEEGRRAAMVETRTVGADAGLAQLIRFQFTNLLGSALLELDDQAQIITYEEYFPYGSSSYQAVRNQTDTPKRYRYTGKERDAENDLYYHGARYYAPWLGRWVSCDPAGATDHLNLYVYTSNNPIAANDPTGMWEWRDVAVVVAVVAVSAVVTVATAGAAAPVIAGLVASAGATGIAATVATGVVVGAVAGAAGGAAGEVARQVGKGEELSGHKILVAAGTGAALGAVTGGLGAYASTAKGAAQLASASKAISSTAQRVAPTLTKAVAATAKGVSAVGSAAAKAPVLGKAIQVTKAALTAVERGGENRGIAFAKGVFSEGSTGAQAVGRFAETRSIAEVFDRPFVRSGSYDTVQGHHIHQGASYGTGSARTTNPNYDEAVTVAHGPGFTRAQHRLADAVQRNLNRGIRGATVNQPQVGNVAISAKYEGQLAATPTPYFEDVKAYYSLRAAGQSQQNALDLVEQSSRQLARAGAVPVRVPQR
jgi:RHS repeat-associated protein